MQICSGWEAERDGVMPGAGVVRDEHPAAAGDGFEIVEGDTVAAGIDDGMLHVGCDCLGNGALFRRAEYDDLAVVALDQGIGCRSEVLGRPAL